MNDHSLVTKRVAVGLKEIGFDGPTWAVFEGPMDEDVFAIYWRRRVRSNNHISGVVDAPSWTQAAMWIFQRFAIKINLDGDGMGSIGDWTAGTFSSYEGIFIHAIKSIKDKQND